MSRNALARLFERLVVASLPLVAPACKSSTHASTPADMSTPSTNGGDDLATGDAPSDMAHGMTAARDFAGYDLLGVDLYDPCETGTDPPPAIVPFPAGDYPDGGFAMMCEAGTFCNKYCPTAQSPVATDGASPSGRRPGPGPAEQSRMHVS